jgi:hypothetical protein
MYGIYEKVKKGVKLSLCLSVDGVDCAMKAYEEVKV